MPRYFVTVAIGISTLLIVTRGHRPFLSVNVMWTDFVSFVFILHFLSQSWVRFKWYCKCCAAARASACDAKMTVSSAKVPIVLFYFKLQTGVRRSVNEKLRMKKAAILLTAGIIFCSGMLNVTAELLALIFCNQEILGLYLSPGD
jgi:hypothetical protein